MKRNTYTDSHYTASTARTSMVFRRHSCRHFITFPLLRMLLVLLFSLTLPILVLSFPTTYAFTLPRTGFIRSNSAKTNKLSLLAPSTTKILFSYAHPTLLYSTTHPTDDENIITTTPPPSSPILNYDQPLPNSIPSAEILSTYTKFEQEFYTMMTQFSSYTPKDIATIRNPSYKALYEGVLAGSDDILVMNAFAIIFNDLLPIRIAGRMIYNHLKNVMDESIEKRIKEEERVMNETGLSLDAINDGRKTFMAALLLQKTNINNNDNDGSNTTNNNDADDDGYLTMTELIESGIVEMVVELMEYESFDAFIKILEEHEKEKFSFETFMIGLQKCALMKTSGGTMDDEAIPLCDMSCDLEEVLSVTAQRMAPVEAKKREMTVSERKKKYSDRYDEMVKSFEEWESLVPSGDGRMIQVLNGCFAGAKNEKIVQALKIVYLDYSALRVGGDLVFKLMGKLVNRRRNKP